VGYASNPVLSMTQRISNISVDENKKSHEFDKRVCFISLTNNLTINLDSRISAFRPTAYRIGSLSRIRKKVLRVED